MKWIRYILSSCCLTTGPQKRVHPVLTLDTPIRLSEPLATRLARVSLKS